MNSFPPALHKVWTANIREWSASAKCVANDLTNGKTQCMYVGGEGGQCLWSGGVRRLHAWDGQDLPPICMDCNNFVLIIKW